MAFSRRKTTLITTIVYHKSYFDNKPSTYDSFYSSKKGINNGLSSSQKVFGCLTSSYEVTLSTTNQVITMVSFIKKGINNGLSSSQKVFGHTTFSYKVVWSMTNEITTITFCRRNYALTMAKGRHKRYLVVQLPHMKLNLRRQLSSTYDEVVLSKMSVSNSLISNIVLPARLFPTVIDGLLLSAILIYDDFLCCCNKL